MSIQILKTDNNDAVLWRIAYKDRIGQYVKIFQSKLSVYERLEDRLTKWSPEKFAQNLVHQGASYKDIRDRHGNPVPAQRALNPWGDQICFLFNQVTLSHPYRALRFNSDTGLLREARIYGPDWRIHTATDKEIEAYNATHERPTLPAEWEHSFSPKV